MRETRPAHKDSAKSWGCSSIGRALAWHARGRGFEAPQLHQYGQYGRSAAQSPSPLGAKRPCEVWVKPTTVHQYGGVSGTVSHRPRMRPRHLPR